MHLDYTGIRVRDLQRSLRFYGRGLGLLEIRRGTMDHGGSWILMEDQVSRQRLELNWYRPGSRYATGWKSGDELDHLGVRTEDADGLARRLIEAGAKEIDRIKQEGEPDVIFVQDPDGIVIELLPEPQLLLPVPAT